MQFNTQYNFTHFASVINFSHMRLLAGTRGEFADNNMPTHFAFSSRLRISSQNRKTD